MRVIDHGAWTTYAPTNPYPAAPANALHCKRDSDNVDWWGYLYGSDAEHLDPQTNFKSDTIKMTVDGRAIVQQVTRDATMIFPQGCRVLEVEGDEVADPFASYNGKIWSGGGFVDAPPLIPDISRRQFFQQLARDGKITAAEALEAVKIGAIPFALQGFVDSVAGADARLDVEMLLCGATTFLRSHSLTQRVAGFFGYSPDATDELFRRANRL